MTVVPLSLFSSPRLVNWDRVVHAVRIALQLGATFRIAGRGIQISNLTNERLHAELSELAESGILRSFLLSGDDPDREALAFADKLGVARVLVQTREEARAAIRQLIRDIRENDGHFGFDIETSPRPGQGAPRPTIQFNKDGRPSEEQPPWKERAGLDPHRAEICSAQCYVGGRAAYVFRREALKLVLSSHWLRRQHLVVHNAAFETKFVQHHFPYRRPAERSKRGRLDCTMQAAGLVHGIGERGEKRSLERVATAVLGITPPKALQTSDWAADELSDGQIGYASVDAIVAWRLWPLLASEMDRHRCWEAYRLQRGVIGAVADMELRGLGIDRQAHAEQCRKWAKELADANAAFKEETGQTPPTKQADVQDWLRQALATEAPQELQSWPRTPRHQQLSTRSAHLKRIAPTINSARLLLQIRARKQLLDNFGKKLAEHISPVTGRVHGSYNIAATKAGRFSASSPNLQQLPKKREPGFRRCIAATPGNVLVRGDWSQIELRAGAWLTKDATMSRLLAAGTDMHKMTASRITGIPFDQITDADRNKAKSVNFGAVYGIGPNTLQQNIFAEYGIEVSVQWAENAIRQFFNLFRGWDEWRWRNYRECKARRRILIAGGRRVEADWEVDVGGQIKFTRASNIPVQGSCANLLLLALARAYARLKEEGLRGGLVACVHDELLLEVHEDDAAIASAVLEEVMIDAFKATFPGAPVTGLVEIETGKNWLEMKVAT